MKPQTDKRKHAMTQRKRSLRALTAPQAGVRMSTRLKLVGAVTRAVRKRQRKSPALSQSVAADRLGITRQRMSTILNNAGNWTMDTIGDLIFAFDLQIEEIKIVLDEDLKVSNYVSPMSQASRTIAPLPMKPQILSENRIRNGTIGKSNFTSMGAPKATVTVQVMVPA
jgi:plasmid maintenance system antidote protein VapI